MNLSVHMSIGGTNRYHEITKLKKDDIDVMNIDGGHLNDYGNLIYGKITAQEILKIIKDDKN